MGTDATDVMETLPCPRDIKVHRLMCTKLIKVVNRILKIFPEIEASRPRCSSGLQALCLLNCGIEKAKLLLRHCSESSKLYLAITADALLSRCKKSSNLLEQSLSQIQNNVPVMLASEISRIINDLRDVKFSLDSSEEEVGKVLRAFIQQYASSGDSKENSAIETIRFAALKLQITSQKALLIEKRSIKKLLDKVGDVDPAKKQILWYFMDLLKKYGRLISREQTDNACPQNKESSAFASSYDISAQVKSHAEHGPDETKTDMLKIPPEEFKCPLSFRLMYDPVVIASGQTFERVWIQKWFDEGRDSCPKTKTKLAHFSLTPNVALKDLISKWCTEYGVTIPNSCEHAAAVQSWETSSASIASLSNSMNDLYLPMDFSNVSLGSLDSINSDSSSAMIDSSNLASLQTNDVSRFQSCTNTMQGNNKWVLNKLDELPWESQCEVVEDVKSHLKLDSQACQSMSFENFVEPLVRFLKCARDLHDVKAQRSGTWLLLRFVRMCRSSISQLREEAYSLLASFLDSEVTEEALAIMAELSRHRHCRPKIAASGAPYPILKILETQIRELVEPAIKILYNLSTSNDIGSFIVPSELIPKLVPFFEDTSLARYFISILTNLCHDEDSRVSVAETDGCIGFVAKLLEIGSDEVQEHAVNVLLSLCSHRVQYCQMVMDEGVIPALVHISINGNEKGMASALELLRLLRDIDYSNTKEGFGSDLDLSRDSTNQCKEKKLSSKASGIFGVKISIFSKSSSSPKKRK